MNTIHTLVLSLPFFVPYGLWAAEGDATVSSDQTPYQTRRSAMLDEIHEKFEHLLELGYSEDESIIMLSEDFQESSLLREEFVAQLKGDVERRLERLTERWKSEGLSDEQVAQRHQWKKSDRENMKAERQARAKQWKAEGLSDEEVIQRERIVMEEHRKQLDKKRLDTREDRREETLDELKERWKKEKLSDVEIAKRIENIKDRNTEMKNRREEQEGLVKRWKSEGLSDEEIRKRSQQLKEDLSKKRLNTRDDQRRENLKGKEGHSDSGQP